MLYLLRSCTKSQTFSCGSIFRKNLVRHTEKMSSKYIKYLTFLGIVFISVAVMGTTSRKLDVRKRSIMTSSSIQQCELPSLSKCQCDVSPHSDSFTVDCSQSGIKEVPNTYQNHITHLKLDFNNISIIKNFSFLNTAGSNLENLIFLSLNNNNLTFIEDLAFDGLARLETLLLYNNNLYAAFQRSTLIFMPLRNSLKVLDIRKNIRDECVTCRRYPGATVKPLGNLTELYMDGIDRRPLDMEFKSLENLRKLVFSGGRGNVAHIMDNMFRAVPMITELDGSGIGIGFWDKALQFLPNIKVLNLCDNPAMTSRVLNIARDVTSVPLEKLYMNNTGIEDHMEIFIWTIGENKEKGKNMRVLTLDSNSIYDFTDFFSKQFPNLEILSLGDNYWNPDSRFFADLFKMKHLVGLNISWQQGASMMSRAKRSLHDNKLHFCQVGTACPLNLPQNLEWVDLSHFGFQLPQVPEMAWLTNSSLKYLNAAYTGISSIPYMMFCPASLHVVLQMQTWDVTGNSLQCINSSAFSNCSMEALEHLYLGKNSLGWTGVSVCNNEQDDNLAFLKSFKNLKIIDLQENNLNGRIPQDVFINNTKLQNINLAGNGLVEMNITFDHLLDLEMLNLANNNIKCLAEPTFRALDHLQRKRHGESKITIDMSQNPLSCNCSCLPFYQWLAKTKIVFINMGNYACKFPDGSTVQLRRLSTILVKLEAWCGETGTLEIAWSVTILINVLVALGTVIFRLNFFLLYISSNLFWKINTEAINQSVRLP